VGEVAAARAALVEKARANRLAPADLEAGTFTVSNLGMFGIDEFVAVLNPPQVAILAAGSIAERPLALDGELALAPTLHLFLTCDHRAVDGADGAAFLTRLRELIESPPSDLR
jgi:pyruvate dehydrogenase E2 component (dihydrolipoamide acetyltransferase)